MRLVEATVSQPPGGVHFKMVHVTHFKCSPIGEQPLDVKNIPTNEKPRF